MIYFVLVCVLIIVALVSVLICFIKSNKKLKQEKKEIESDLETQKKLSETYAKEKRENEELVQKMHSGANLDSANASVELLQKLSEKGRQRNNQ